MERQSWLCFPKPCCGLSFSNFLPSPRPYFGTNVNYFYAIIISIHTMLSFAFSCVEQSVIIVICNKKQTN